MHLATAIARLPEQTVVTRAVMDALARRPRALFIDIDGTISPIADTPEQATVSPACREGLRRLASVLDLVCILTGRPADDAWRMVGVDDALYVGNHGAETWLRGELLRPPGIERYDARLGRASGALRTMLASAPGIVFEDKGIGFAIHFRRDPSAEAAVVEAATRVGRRHGLHVLRRSAHVEVRAPVEADKGVALGELARRHGLAGLVVIGDDPVDAPAFEAARAYAQASGASVAVVTVGEGVRGTGDVSLDDPDATCALLSEAAAELGA